MLLDVLLIAAFISAVAGTYTPWSKIQGLEDFPRKAFCVVYILSWIILLCFGLSGIDYIYSYKEALR